MVFAILLGGAILFWTLKIGQSLERVYPNTNCENVMSTIQGTGHRTLSPEASPTGTPHQATEGDLLFKLAKEEWMFVREVDLLLSVDTISTAHLQCYCI
jgi:hypothetical protein